MRGVYRKGGVGGVDEPFYRLFPISCPELSNFLWHMLDENEGLWKGLVLIVRK